MRNGLLNKSFQFVAKGIKIPSDVAEAAALFPAVREQLSVDGCARKFILEDDRISAADIRSLQFLLSGESISIRRSQGFLCCFFGKCESRASVSGLFEIGHSDESVGIRINV
jgi:hypothetical protein